MTLGLWSVEVKSSLLIGAVYVGRGGFIYIPPEFMAALLALFVAYGFYRLKKDLLDTDRHLEVYRDKMQKWLIRYFPLLFTGLLSIIGLLDYSYPPLCHIDGFITGFKILIPLAVLYTSVVSFSLRSQIAGLKNLIGNVILETFIICIICSFLITVTFIPYINGILDLSEPELRHDHILDKIYLSKRREYSVTLKELHDRRWCNSLAVSKNFYEKARIGDAVEYEVKKGFLGIEWIYKGLKLTGAY